MRPVSVFPDYLVKLVIPASRAITKPAVICRCVPLMKLATFWTLDHYADGRTDFRGKNGAIFSGELFSGEELLPEKAVLGQ